MDEIVNVLIKNLTIDASNTTLAISKKISRSDPRSSSAHIGRMSGAVMIALPCLIVCLDLSRLYRRRKRILKKKNNRVLP